MSRSETLRRPPSWFRVVDRVLRSTIAWFTCSLLVLMVIFTIYTVIMRYVFHDPPFWGDTVALFCNIWLVLLAYTLAVRERQDIASAGQYWELGGLPKKAPMMVLPISGILVALMSAFTLAEDTFGWNPRGISSDPVDADRAA
jgi:TRAP-type C4-dicarboxylate transport system permease small subunit